MIAMAVPRLQAAKYKLDCVTNIYIYIFVLKNHNKKWTPQGGASRPEVAWRERPARGIIVVKNVCDG